MTEVSSADCLASTVSSGERNDRREPCNVALPCRRRRDGGHRARRAEGPVEGRARRQGPAQEVSQAAPGGPLDPSVPQIAYSHLTFFCRRAIVGIVGATPTAADAPPPSSAPCLWLPHKYPPNFPATRFGKAQPSPGAHMSPPRGSVPSWAFLGAWCRRHRTDVCGQ